MALLDIRKQFVQMSGRYDLVVNATAWADNGANFFINAGLKEIDRRVSTYKSYSRVFAEVSSGDFYTLFQNCRSVLKVWCSDLEEKWELEKKSPVDFKSYFNEPMSAVDSGAPLYYALGLLRTQPEDATTITIDQFGHGTPITEGTAAHYTYNALLFGPPADGDYLIEIWGFFLTPALSADTDANYWTEINPMALLYASLYVLETSYRNNEGAKDWESALMTQLQTVEFDFIEEQISEITELGG